ncbi:MAG: flagellar hook assembly protein FlgD [Lachnospiraceae bacterium]
MSIIAPLVDGEFKTSTSSTSISNSDKKDSNSEINSEAFLTLLVAEMQNQDPLEPTSNTEWISQYATFTEVSEIQEIGSNMSSIQAQNLVGEHVIMKVTNEAGNTDYISGPVDYVVYENKDTYLSINGELYSIADLDTVASADYMEAYNLALNVTELIKKLPGYDNITIGNKDTIESLHDTAEKMTDYEKSFLDKSVFDAIDVYYQKLQALLGSSNASDDSQETDSGENDGAENADDATNGTGDTDNVGGAENAEGTTNGNGGVENADGAEEHASAENGAGIITPPEEETSTDSTSEEPQEAIVQALTEDRTS